MSNLSSIEVGVVQQALVVGQVINSLTEEAISSAVNIEVAIRYTGDVAFRPFPVPVRIISAGYFTFAGSPMQVLPLKLAPTDTVEFRFNVTAPGFTPLEDTVMVSAASVTPSDTDTVLAGHSLEVSLVSAPILQRTLALTPLAVGLIGVVIADNDPDDPLSGVSIQVIAPEIGSAVTSDTLGRYRIDSLPVAESVILEVELNGNLTTFNHVLDYATPYNSRIISLN